MKFHLELDIKKPAHLIGHQNPLFLIGSCFTENISEKLKKYKFHVLENPNGILFNPASVAEAITSYIEKPKLTEKDLFFFNEGWHSWKHHSRFSALTPEDALSRINASIEQAHDFMKKADQVMITLGSSWIYTLTDKAVNGKKGSVAANNHKAPADWFNRRLMTPEEVVSVLDNMIHRLFLFNQHVQIIFTISPVRHIRDGVIENNRSKAVLIQSVHHLVEKFDNLYYFPSYELVIDDLRDYRFYSEDMVHPNYYATQYVWDKFIAACMTEKTKKLMEEIHKVNLAFQHKPFNPTSEQHKKFMRSYLDKTKELQQKLPGVDWEQEVRYFGGIEY